MSAFCRDCLTEADDTQKRCRACGSPRLLRHNELFQLSMAHLDCDAFYAAVEKRDAPEIRDKPVIIGGGKRGVVSTCCYIARIRGVHSAMPMFKALEACPEAIVIRPDMAKYARVARDVRARMESLTPLVEPLSLDEAFMDLSGTERLHGMPPAKALARLAQEIERDVGITVSIGLSHNKFLAKVASDLNKPRGFAVIGKAETLDFLRDRPVTTIFGVGKSFARKLAGDGITRIGQLQTMPERELVRRYGRMGFHLARLANGEDSRRVDPDGPARTISTETTFAVDIARHTELAKILWRLSETLSARAKKAEIGGRVVTLKLKSRDFKLETRRRSLDAPTQLAARIYDVAHDLLTASKEGPAYRLIGVGLSELAPADACDEADLFKRTDGRAAAAERAMDHVRGKFGTEAIKKGRALRDT